CWYSLVCVGVAASDQALVIKVTTATKPRKPCWNLTFMALALSVKLPEPLSGMEPTQQSEVNLAATVLGNRFISVWRFL
ncbi:hypothetical protein Q4595_30275, partial [Wenyingzhuangia sp. 1_MG-2023]|nr:hypothetical protein [Wenyingzhuangia sp. 1_MG-2023]